MEIALATCANLPDWEVDDRPLVKALQSHGARVVEPAWDDPRIDWSRFDACLIRTTWDYTARKAAFMAWAARIGQVTRLYNPAAIVSWNTHKAYLRELSESGISIAPTVWIAQNTGDTCDIQQLVKAQGWTHAFLKPVVGASAESTLRFRCDTQGLEAASALLTENLPRVGFMLQPYLKSVEKEGEISALFMDGEFTHAVRKVPVPGDYRVQDDYGASDFPIELTPSEIQQAQAIVAHVEARFTPGEHLLYARVDFLRDDSGALMLNELELIEPSLFFRHAPHAAERLACGLVDRVRNSP